MLLVTPTLTSALYTLTGMAGRVSWPQISCWIATYRGHKLVRAANAGHSVLIQVFLDEALYWLVPLHKGNVGQIETKQHQCLIPVDVVIPEENDECDETGGVEGTITKQGPPGESEHSFAEYGAHSDHKQDVENRWANNGANTNIVEGHEHTNDASEELWCWTTGRHEGGTSHIILNVKLFNDDVQWRNKELVADDGERYKHVHDTNEMKDDGSLSSLFHGEQIIRKERVFGSISSATSQVLVFSVNVVVWRPLILKAGSAERAEEQTACREQPDTLHVF